MYKKANLPVGIIVQPVTFLKGVGKALAEKLEKLHIYTCQDLLFLLPIRYQNKTRIMPIKYLRLGMEALFQGTIISSKIVYGRRRSLVCALRDDSGIVYFRLFHFSGTQQKQLSVGKELLCFGEPRRGASGLEFYHPEYRVLGVNAVTKLEPALTPVYPTTDGVSQHRLRVLCDQVIALLKESYIPDLLPQSIRKRYQLFNLIDAISFLHHPPGNVSLDALQKGVHPAQKRLIFEELLAHRLSAKMIRKKWCAIQSYPSLNKQDLTKKLIQLLPFTLTQAQKRVLETISNDIEKTVPMLRLIQGDVGSGKTIVAALAALQIIENGYQVALMAPTEVLAEQHERTFRLWMSELGVSMAFLSGKSKGKKRQQELERIASGEAVMIIGTHALFQEDVVFNHLALAIIDEQHRFGVHQRMLLRKKGEQVGKQPHQLIMTATPIPRTLAMSAYATLDCSVIDELPPGRTPVHTVVLKDDRRSDVIKRLRQVYQEGRQAYWVCTLIKESEVIECQAAEATWEQLKTALPEVTVGLVHGRMTAVEKSNVMQGFAKGEVQLLVATTVIEVGVDVPNASIMVIENPERLGLSQLHQLRGRVGRGSVESYCILMYRPPLSFFGRQRLEVMRNSTDGFYIAEKDLELRGAGEILGTKQTGLARMKVACLERDGFMLNDVKLASEEVLQSTPENVTALIARWLPFGEQYTDV